MQIFKNTKNLGLKQYEKDSKQAHFKEQILLLTKHILASKKKHLKQIR